MAARMSVFLSICNSPHNARAIDIITGANAKGKQGFMGSFFAVGEGKVKIAKGCVDMREFFA